MTELASHAAPTQASEAAPKPEIVWDGSFHSYRPTDDWRSKVSPTVRFFEPDSMDVDPVVLEVLRYRMWTINVAHGTTIQRISGSPILQILDFNMCILTGDGEIVMNAPYFQHLNSGAPYIVKYILENFGGEPGIKDGDIFLCNDPWIGAVHQMDVFIGMPVFVDGKIVAWVTNAAHQADLGGTAPGGFPQNAPDVFHDPTVFTPVKIVEAGTLRKDIEAAYLRQSRAPSMVAIDLRGQIAGVEFARSEILRACEQFGAATVRSTMARILDSAQQDFAELLKTIPDGTWTQVRYFDENLPGDRRTHRMQVNFHKEGDRLRIDNHGTDAQVDGPIGFTFACFKGAVLGGITLSTLYEQLFAAGGADRQIDWDVQPGLLNCVDWPAAVSAGSSQQLGSIDLAFETMSKMLTSIPGREDDVQAQSGSSNVLVFFGATETVSPSLPSADALGTGAGAHLDRDGIDTAGSSHSPLSLYPSTEETEMSYPILYLYRQQQIDSGGAGEFRGGVGNRFALASYDVDTLGLMTAGSAQSATTHSAPGLFGGYPSPTNETRVLRGANARLLYERGRVPVRPDDFDPSSQQRLGSKTEALPFKEEDVVLVRVPGGGGVGDPLNRDPQRVAEDVVDGLVSVQAATDVYGVVLGEDQTVDLQATQSLRDEYKRQRRDWTPVAEIWPEGESETTGAIGEPAFSIHPRIMSVDAGSERILQCTCGHRLAAGTANYKYGLLVDEQPVTAIPLVEDPTEFIDEPMAFRRYCCPGCLTMLVTEIARKADDPLPDVALG
ncbi:hydantoinase B/oxoprolinase family protein [Brevibacterium daeguense]|uniref:Hydantoinase B/oxoprolinase family protein n=1 Tax=Brevibacterium daeguense TaxID=909936 RepID=A0ABP8EIM0_9MICO|nr:hydantoinase B/oxoprolinase family protein [Brevibacterium daeguense]